MELHLSYVITVFIFSVFRSFKMAGLVRYFQVFTLTADMIFGHVRERVVTVIKCELVYKEIYVFLQNLNLGRCPHRPGSKIMSKCSPQ
jgi:hypothetical protein